MSYQAPQGHHNQQPLSAHKLIIEEPYIEQMDVQQNIDEDDELQLQINLLEDEQLEQILQQNSQKMIEELNNNDIKQDIVSVIKNPVSAYMMFIKSWKEKHPNEKFNVSSLGAIWKSMTLSQKQPYQSQYKANRIKYDEYQAALLINNPEKHQQDNQKYLFPLHRIKAIMKQDSFYAPKIEATTAMAKSTQYFGEYMLQQIKKFNQGKNRLDAKSLFDCINNHKSFAFLQCLIEDYNKVNGGIIKQKKIKPQNQIRLDHQQSAKAIQKKQKVINRQTRIIKSNNKQNKNAGQQLLDNFFKKG